MYNINMPVIAHIENDYPTKFGIPRQSGLVKSLQSTIIFEPEYRFADALKGLEGFSHIWLLWVFSENINKDGKNTWSHTVRPPRLGGNTHVGVFATRSPFRPGPIGLSCVKIEKIDLNTSFGPTILVSGADLMNSTPIIDIKPYIPYTDSIPEASGGFSTKVHDYSLDVIFPQELLELIPEPKREALIELLSQDPRPSYHNDPDRTYGFGFAGYEIKFYVSENTLTVYKVEPWHTA